MRTIKKIFGMLLSTMLLFVFVSTIAYAAPGSVTFTDLATSAGEEFTVRMGIRSGGATLGECNIVLNYDNQAIEFISADNVSASGNILTYSATGNSDYAFTEMQFRALKQGETKITIDSCEVKDSQGTVLSLDEGNSTVKVEGGTEIEATETAGSTEETTQETTEEVVDEGGININGIAYTIGTEFSSTDIPNGYTEATVTYNGVEYAGVKSDTAEIQLLYLLNDAQEGEFFYFDVETNTFSPYVQVTVSDSTFIVFLNTAFDEVLPEQFVETTLTVSGYEFPTWEDTTNKGYYLIHAISSNGEKGAYLYDSAEQTYQRYMIPEVVVEEVVEEDFATTVVAACGEYLLYVLIGIASVVILMFLLVIITLVKLRNRNLELDDLYDELDYRSDSKKVNYIEKNNQNDVNRTQPKKVKKKVEKLDEFDSLILTDDVENQHEFKADFNDEYDELDNEFDLSEVELDYTVDSRKTRNIEEKGSVQRKIKKPRPTIEDESSKVANPRERRTGLKDKKGASESTGRKIRGNRPANDKPVYIDL